MKNTTWKNIRRDIFSSFSRFIAIFAITALGAGFFAGLSAVGPDMEATANNYYANSNLMDFSFLSSLGFTADDVNAVKAETGISAVEAAYRLDLLVEVSGEEEVFRFHSLPEDCSGENSSYISQLTLVEGRFPEKSGECIIGNTARTAEGKGLQIGGTITVLFKNDKNMLEMITPKVFTVVGRVNSPRYLTKFLGTTSVGTGTISNFLYISISDFEGEYYTELLITVDKQGISNFNTDSYQDLVTGKTAAFEAFGNLRAQIRYDDIYAQGQKTLDEGRAEYDENYQAYLAARKNAERQFADAQQEINDNRAKLQQAKDTLATGKAEIEANSKTIASGWQEVNSSAQTLSANRNTLVQKDAEYNAGLQQYRENLALYQQNKAAYDNALADVYQLSAETASLPAQLEALDSAAAGLPDTAEPFQNTADSILQTVVHVSAFLADSSDAAPLKQQLDDLVSTYQALPQDENHDTAAYALLQNVAPLQPPMAQALSSGQAALTAREPALAEAAEQLRNAKSRLDTADAQLQSGWQQLENGEAQLYEAKQRLFAGEAQQNAAKQQIADAEIEISKGEVQLQEGKEKLAAEEEKAEKEFADAAQKLANTKIELAEGQEVLNKLDLPKWYVFSRESGISGYSGFWSDIRRIKAIGKVITPFFFLVAALVCLTTMTRMVEEERTQTGTKKALGYGKFSIAFKYIFYAGIACIAGSVVGIAAGMYLFPNVIFDAYRLLYKMPDLVMASNWNLAFFSAAISVLCILAATIGASYAELVCAPSDLMRPKAPAAGKRVLLERIPFLWNRLSFSWKVTMRNLLRNKRRFLMTIVGVLGCTALVVTGFGLKDCISGIASVQYQGIYKYDYEITLKNSVNPEDASELNSLLPEIGPALYVQTTSVNPSSEKTASTTLDTSIVVLYHAEMAEDFFSLRNRKTQTTLVLPEQGAVVTEKLAAKLQLKVGDNLHLQTTETDGTEKEGDFIVFGITENYVGHAVYLSAPAYQNGFGYAPEYNGLRLLIRQQSSAAASPGPENPPQKQRDIYLEKLVNTQNVAAAMDINVIMDSVDNMLNSLNALVLLILGCAALLAFVVLYNLTNINITERTREIATLKVLGFYDREVSAYIYRENIMLTLIGICVGLLAGNWLTAFVLTVAEIDDVVFRKNITPMSFFLSAVITLSITLFVNLVMEKRLRRVNMVESLKSAE